MNIRRLVVESGSEAYESNAAVTPYPEQTGQTRLSVIALDYDGTISVNDTLELTVRNAIAAARRRGVQVILVTGRRLSDLSKLIGDLSLFDAVVAENGAVIAYPSSGHSSRIAPPPPPLLIQELTRRGITAQCGECVIEAEAEKATAIISVLRDLELPLAIVFNRTRLMVLPPAITKGTGLREVLSSLRVSSHNALGIGDAENDHELLSACEVGMAVSWGTDALKRSADHVLEGTGPADVATYIQQAAQKRRLPRTFRHRLVLGSRVDGTEVSLAVQGRNVLISGDAKSGKSWIAGLLCEQLILQRYSVFVIDPEGDYRSLEVLPGVLVFGEEKHPPPLTEVTHMLQHPDISVVADLSSLPHHEKVTYIRTLLRLLSVHRQETGLPHRVIVDEAHYFLHEPDVLELLDLNLSGYTLVSYRPSLLHPQILAAGQAIISTRVTDPAELEALSHLCRPGVTEAEAVRRLQLLARNEAALLPGIEESSGGICTFQVAPRFTAHVRHSHKYVDVPVPTERAFIFTDRQPQVRARTLKEFIEALFVTGIQPISAYLERHDFSRWIDQVFGDYILAGQIGKLESVNRPPQLDIVRDEIARLIEERYTIRFPRRDE